MIYGYIRVSSDKQTVENQRFEIERFCKVNNLHIDGWIEETISGTGCDHLLRVVTAWKVAIYDYGDTQYLHEERVPRMDYQG